MKNIFQGHRSFAHQRILAIFVILLGSLLTACSSGLQVRSETDPNANFSQYTTYNFFSPMGIESGYNSPIFGEEFRTAISREMNQKGYKVEDVPDLLINVTFRSDDKIKITSYTSPYMSGGYYGRPGGAYYGSAVGVGISTGSRDTKTTEASIFIDLVDYKHQSVVWQGIAVVNVTDKVAQQLRDAIYTAVNKMFMEYPHTAGN